MHIFYANAGFNCQAVVKANTEAEVLSQAALHAREAHGVEVTPEMAQQLRSLIRSESEESRPEAV